MAILVTGGSGFLGTVLTQKLLAKGHTIYSLSRHPPDISDKVIPLTGDILKPGLGIEPFPKLIMAGMTFDACYHLAAIHTLQQEDKDGSIWRTNVDGTKNVLAFCARHNIPHLYFCSTAYDEGRNPYEKSKQVCELMIYESDIPKVTIFKPSIFMGTAEHPYPGHFSQFISILVKTLRKAGLIKSSFENALGLPILEFALRIRGNPDGYLNLVTVEAVADFMAETEATGTFWLTNPNPPLLKDLVKWVGEFISFDFRIMPDFTPRLLESQFMKMIAPFEPYLQGDDFTSDIPECPPITREFIYHTILNSIS